MKKILAIAITTTALAGCGVNQNDAKKTLEAQGFSEIEVGGWSLFGCSEQDTFRSKFKAVGVNGQPVDGVLCSGILKGMTVRFN